MDGNSAILAKYVLYDPWFAYLCDFIVFASHTVIILPSLTQGEKYVPKQIYVRARALPKVVLSDGGGAMESKTSDDTPFSHTTTTTTTITSSSESEKVADLQLTREILETDNLLLRANLLGV